jgi:hypothetical protein
MRRPCQAWGTRGVHHYSCPSGPAYAGYSHSKPPLRTLSPDAFANCSVQAADSATSRRAVPLSGSHAQTNMPAAKPRLPGYLW